MKRWSSVLYGLINARISDILYQSCSFWKGQRKNNLFVEIGEDSYIVAVGEEEEVELWCQAVGAGNWAIMDLKSVTGPGRLTAMAAESRERKNMAYVYSVYPIILPVEAFTNHFFGLDLKSTLFTAKVYYHQWIPIAIYRFQTNFGNNKGWPWNRGISFT